MLPLWAGGRAGLLHPRRVETVFFFSFVVAGLLTPFLKFTDYILDFYKIHLAHLVPNSIVVLSTFAHL